MEEIPMKTSLYRLAPAAALLLLSAGLAGCPACEDEGVNYAVDDEWTNSAGDECVCVDKDVVDCVTPCEPCTHEGETYECDETWVDSVGDNCTCDDGDVTCVTPTLLRGVHLVPDLAIPCDLDGDTATPDDIGAACIDLYVEDSTVPLNLESGPFPFAASTAFTALPLTGTLTFHVVAYGDANETANRILSIPVTLVEGDSKTFIAYGLVAATAVGTDVSDTDISNPATGKARVKVFHGELATLGAATLDVWLGVGGVKITEDLAYSTYSTAMEVDPSTDVMVAIDTDDNGVPEWVTAGLPTTGITTVAGEIYDLFLVINPTYDNLDPTSPPMLMLVHTPDSNAPEVLGIFQYVP
jgi:hypothetical protein